MAKKFTDQDDALLDALGVVVEPEKVAAHTPREERIIAAFEEIQCFVETQGRHRVTGKTATSSSGSMPCAWTASANRKSAGRW